ncbi:ATP-dependent DNA helicase PIF1, partial [Cucumispora dikerogammari]
PCNENCLIDNQCKKKYPKRFIEQTVFVSNDFPHYRRRNLPSIIYMGEDYNNSFVVPYNRELCKIYSSHINVELCSSLGTIKYLNKYITKGMEAQNQPVGQGTNEADRYRNSRFDTAMEAAWRIFEFPMWQISHSVMGLPVHLDDRNPTETLVTGFGRNVTRNTPRSKLEAFFLLTETDESARVYSYVQIPEFYKWAEVVARLWIRRTPTHSGQLGRLYPVPIFEQERYALRLLLCHVIGPRSFTDIRTVNGTLHPSYVEAAKALGLIETTHPYELTFREAVDFATPKQLRVLFVNLLGYGMPNGVSLFNEFFNVLSGDFGSQTLFVNRRLYLIYLIKRLFEQRDKVALDFLSFNDFQSIDIEMPNTIENNVEDLPTLNPQQRSVFNNIVEKVTSAVSCLVYLDGPAGTGKTFLINRVITHLKAINKFSIVCAPTGLAASLLIGGRTLHSFFNIPLCIEETSRCGIKRNSQRAQFIREASLLIIDEVGMVDANVLNMINHLMKKIMNNDRDFGGKIVLFTGDLRQLSFVYPDSHPFVFETCVFALSEFYQACEKLALVENMRSYSSPAYVHFIQNIGDGVGMTETVQYGRVSEIPVCYLSTNLVVDIYSGLNELSENELLMRQLLCSTNRKVDEYNMKILNLLEGDEYSLTGINKLGGNPRGYITNNYTPEILARLDIDSLPPTNIEVKLNCPLVILRNFDIWCGVVNGTKAILKRVFNNSLELLIMSGKSKGEYFILPRVYFNTEVDQLPFELIRQQYPIRVAFASTIHKSQGQTYDFVGVSLENPVFCHGQLYVALSRCTSGRNMKVTVSGSRYQGVEEGITYVVNVVNRNILGE